MFIFCLSHRFKRNRQRRTLLLLIRAIIFLAFLMISFSLLELAGFTVRRTLTLIYLIQIFLMLTQDPPNLFNFTGLARVRIA